MAGHDPNLRQGSIIWIEVSDPRGNVKRRPVIVLTATDEIILDQLVDGVAVTTTFAEPAPSDCIELPWQPNGHPATQLRRRSAAVCSWLVQFRQSEVVSVEGYVPGKTFLRILQTVAEINRGSEPDGESTKSGGKSF